jgi:hypothetical protein
MKTHGTYFERLNSTEIEAELARLKPEGSGRAASAHTN